jgi:hypothetical protein
MNPIVVIIVSFLIIIAIAAPIIYWRIRKSFREQKNFERGLKMVPLLIHLPPPSDDTEVGSRDARDVVDENISKARVLYGIISSTLVKGMKHKFYGQRHFAFEIIAVGGTVKFYAAVPVVLVEVVKQAVIGAYPTAQLEEVSEHNIFSQSGKIGGTVGGELTLKHHFAYPIATYQEIKRDTIQSLLNSLSELTPQDGLAVQLLIRPADSSWRKSAHSEAEKKRKGKTSKDGVVLWWAKQLVVAFTKPPEDKSGGENKHEVSGADQAIIESIEEKTRHPGFETLIRVVASSPTSHRAQSILNNVIATFSLYDAQGRNGFRYTPAKDIDRFITAYILRFFPTEGKSSILNAVELATLFHFPDQKNIPTSQLSRQASKQVDGPRNMPEEGLLLGYNIFRGVKKKIFLGENDRRRHMYVVGQTGTGKSTFLENLAVQDMIAGRGFAFVDPHGESVERLMGMVPKERTEDVIYFSPAEMDYPLGLNLFEFSMPEQKDFLIQEVMSMLYKLYDPQRQGIIGPRYEHIFRNCALLLMSDPNGGTFIDIPKVLIDPAFMKQKLKYVTDKSVLDFWTKEFPASQRSNEAGEVTSWVVSKFGAFLSNEMMRNIIGQIKSSFDMRHIMDEGKILLVNLSKGRTGEINSKLLGMIFVMKFQAAAMSRANIPESQRKDFCLYVDEFQNITTDSFAEIMSEARKYRLNVIVGNQFITQLSEQIRDSVFGNMGTVVAHRVGTNDAEVLEKYFRPTFDYEDLQRLPNYQSIVRTLVGGVPTQPFSMSNLPYLGEGSKELADALKKLSAAKYGRPRAKVEQEIFSRLSVEEPPKPKFGAGSPFGPGGGSAGNDPVGFGQQRTAGPGAGGGPAAKAGGSFLDEWLAKRRMAPSSGAGKPVSPAAASAPPSPAQPSSATQLRPVGTTSKQINQTTPASNDSMPTPAPNAVNLVQQQQVQQNAAIAPSGPVSAQQALSGQVSSPLSNSQQPTASLSQNNNIAVSNNDTSAPARAQSDVPPTTMPAQAATDSSLYSSAEPQQPQHVEMKISRDNNLADEAHHTEGVLHIDKS